MSEIEKPRAGEYMQVGQAAHETPTHTQAKTPRQERRKATALPGHKGAESKSESQATPLRKVGF